MIGRFVSPGSDGWTLATYAFPSNGDQSRALERIAADAGSGRLTGLALVNRELAAQFVPQFLRGLSIGSLVVVLMIALTFRTWRLSILAMVPTAAGLIWAAGLLALARVPLDLFALFAVVTFVGIGIDYGIHLVHRFRDHGDAEVAVAELRPVIVVAGLITLAGYGHGSSPRVIRRCGRRRGLGGQRLYAGRASSPAAPAGLAGGGAPR